MLDVQQMGGDSALRPAPLDEKRSTVPVERVPPHATKGVA